VPDCLALWLPGGECMADWLEQARWVADSSREFLFVPGSSDLLVKVVIGQTGWDIRRVPIAPK
jgi:hypothetical protein